MPISDLPKVGDYRTMIKINKIIDMIQDGTLGGGGGGNPVANVAYVYREGENVDGDWPAERPDIEHVVCVGAAPGPDWMQNGDLLNIPVTPA